ncbi:hypothetical protein BDF22DRAFT_777095 [Syncephalis plumigaleata]|nr:hypothetical protein BDF22DRAFT_777095 [Syncephalis plumigaleata]
MPKNKGKGGKNRRRGKNENDGEKRELILKEEGQEYAQVVKMLGNGRLEAQCFDGEKRLAHIRGKLRKKVWINQGDIILLSLREFQDNKADVMSNIMPMKQEHFKKPVNCLRTLVSTKQTRMVMRMMSATLNLISMRFKQSKTCLHPLYVIIICCLCLSTNG